MSNEIARILADHAALTQGDAPEHLDYVLIDGSGSMEPKWHNFITAADIMLDDIRKSGLKSRVIVHVFDSFDIALIQRDGMIDTVAPLCSPPLMGHFGTTPLYDAINVMGRRLQAINPEKASLLVVTDGEENCSATDVVMARAVLDWCRARGWQVTFLGFDFDNAKQAEALGVDATCAIGVDGRKINDAARAFSGKRIRYGRTGAGIGFTDEEKTKFGGYLK